MVSMRVRVDPDAMASVGSTLAGVAQRMADDVAALEITVTGPGNPWGEDESGTAFAVLYQAVLGQALGALGSYVEQVGEAAVTLTTQAREMAAIDADAAAGISLAAPAVFSAPVGPVVSPAPVVSHPDGTGAGTP